MPEGVMRYTNELMVSPDCTREDGRHFVVADAAGGERQVAIALDGDHIAAGRYFGKREGAAFIGGLI